MTFALSDTVMLIGWKSFRAAPCLSLTRKDDDYRTKIRWISSMCAGLGGRGRRRVGTAQALRDEHAAGHLDHPDQHAARVAATVSPRRGAGHRHAAAVAQ